MTKPNKIETWQMTVPGKLARVSLDVPELKPGEVLVEIAGARRQAPQITAQKFGPAHLLKYIKEAAAALGGGSLGLAERGQLEQE